MGRQRLLAVAVRRGDGLMQIGEPRARQGALHRQTLAAAPNAKLQHVLNMLVTTWDFVCEDRREKAFRWLGFIQGVLWAEGIYSIDELRDHNRPADEPFRPRGT